MHYHMVPLRFLKIWLNLLLISTFLLTCNMLLYKEFITLNSCRMRTSLLESGDLPSAKADGKGLKNGRQRLCRPLADGEAIVHDFIGKGRLCRQLEIDG